eukprot:CAMPEP_0176413796 /NCGR_PEP_ID=MMETSP0127-20121128/4898_1 /TAXON_ID=938130 /ORGANISM="Platyophrya macrostoma, Strain WH" /LENGTH=302 /DNA_ID=CAMNT_0017793617 /DNA_START=115 /DNA_END=1020 /DNA_ORIENTATION=+
MINFQWTTRLSFALRQLRWFFLREMISSTLLHVTRVTEMRVAPAEPLCDRAAELTLEFNKVFSVLRTVLDSQTNISTVRADQLLPFKIALLVIFLQQVLATLQSSEIRLLALKALVIRINCIGIIFRLIVVRTALSYQLLVFHSVFILQSLVSLPSDVLIQAQIIEHQSLNSTVGWELKPLFTKRTVAEIERDSRPVPLLLDSGGDTAHMEDMSTLRPDARRIHESLNAADHAVVVAVLGQSVCFGAFLIQARSTVLLSKVTTAVMSAHQFVLTGEFSLILAFGIDAGLREAWIREFDWLLT